MKAPSEIKCLARKCLAHCQNLLIDFDGTIINSSPGVIESLQATLKELGYPCKTAEKLRWCIGPGIQAVCRRLFEGRDEDFILKAVKTFRHYYDSQGFKNTTIYPGILEFLNAIKASPYRPYLTSMKADVAVNMMVPFLKLENYFLGIHALDPFGPLRFKYELIGKAMEKEGLRPEETATIGDTYHDIESAKKNGLFSIGITWGYGKIEELESAGADCILHNPEELGKYLLSAL